ncbi:MAG TPA: DUF1631 family protein [Burkholderiales bacterium]|nr:DUF1631 family protein [Burkholderiales bacterium]
MPQTASFDTILAQCRDLFVERLSAALAAMLDTADETLVGLVSRTRDQEAQRHYLAARDKVLARRAVIETQFRTRCLREFQERSNRVKKIGESFSDIDLSSTELELVGEDDLNETLKFNAMAARLRQYCEDELFALDQRVGVLLGDASLQAEDNPFTPQAICDAYKQTCRQVDPDVNVRMVLLKLFDDHVLDDIRAIYKAVNALLVENSILPKIRAVAPGRHEKAAPSAAKAAAQADKAAGGEADLFSLLQNLLASNLKAVSQTPAPTAGQGAAAGSMGMGGQIGGAPVLQGPQLLHSLTRVQLGDLSAVTGNVLPLAHAAAEPGTINVLRELKGTSLGSGMTRMDAMTLDIMAMLFDELFDDPKIPIAVKGLIGRLQIPMLKVAIADKAFFSKKTHPARQLLDTLGEISARLPPDFDASNPLYGRLQAILQELIDGFEDDIEIFNGARERLQALMIEQDARIQEQTQSSAKQVEQKETLALAKTVAQAEIKMRIRAGGIPSALQEFLMQEWVKLLIVVHVKYGEQSEEWKSALETMDRLIWSVEPKNTLEERRALVAAVPELLKRLMAGAQLGGTEEAVRTRFLAELRKLHTEAVGKAAPAKELPAAGSAPADDAAMKPQPEAAATTSAGEAVTPLLAVPDLPLEAPVDATVPAPVTAPAPAESAEAPQPLPTLVEGLSLLPKDTREPGAAAQETAPDRPPAGVDIQQRDAAGPVRASPALAASPQPPATGSPDSTAAVTVNNPFGDGKVEVDDLDFTIKPAAGTDRAKPEAKPAELPANLVVGTWVEIREKDTRRLGKLAFVSPLKTRYLFVDRQGKTALECSRAELARRIKLGEVAITEQTPETPLFDRIVSDLVGKLGGKR